MKKERYAAILQQLVHEANELQNSPKRAVREGYYDLIEAAHNLGVRMANLIGQADGAAEMKAAQDLFAAILEHSKS